MTKHDANCICAHCQMCRAGRDTGKPTIRTAHALRTTRRWACLECSEAAGVIPYPSQHVTHAEGETCPRRPAVMPIEDVPYEKFRESMQHESVHPTTLYFDPHGNLTTKDGTLIARAYDTTTPAFVKAISEASQKLSDDIDARALKLAIAHIESLPTKQDGLGNDMVNRADLVRALDGDK